MTRVLLLLLLSAAVTPCRPAVTRRCTSPRHAVLTSPHPGPSSGLVSSAGLLSPHSASMICRHFSCPRCSSALTSTVRTEKRWCEVKSSQPQRNENTNFSSLTSLHPTFPHPCSVVHPSSVLAELLLICTYLTLLLRLGGVFTLNPHHGRWIRLPRSGSCLGFMPIIAERFAKRLDENPRIHADWCSKNQRKA